MAGHTQEERFLLEPLLIYKGKELPWRASWIVTLSWVVNLLHFKRVSFFSLYLAVLALCLLLSQILGIFECRLTCERTRPHGVNLGESTR